MQIKNRILFTYTYLNSVLSKLPSVVKSAANSIDEYGIPQEKFNIIWMAHFWMVSSF